MSTSLATIVIDADNPDALAGFWCAVLGWARLGIEDDGSIEIGPSGEPGITMLLEPADGPKGARKNRIHLDLRPNGADQADELDRLIALGARHVDIGQGSQTWFVLADPEGNEFCLLRTRATRP